MSLPSWYTSISPGQWGTLPNSALTGSGVDETNAYQSVLAWGGGWINTYGIYNGTTFISGTFIMLGPGGGHTDSGLNAVYAYGPLENNSPQWYRVRSSTSPVPQNVVTDASGNPVARHGYAGYARLPGLNKFMVAGAFRYTDASPPGEGIFDLALSNPDGAGVQPWSKPTQADAGTTSKLHDDIQILQPDTANAVVWAWSSTGGGNGNCVGFFNPGAGTWTASGFKSPLVTSSSNTSSCIDTVRGLWMMWFQGSLQFYRTNSGVSNDYYAPTTTGTAPTIGTTSGSGLTGNGSMLFDSVDDQCVVWANNGQALTALKPPATNPYQGGNAWTWSAITVGGSTPGPENGTAAVASGFPGEPASACNGTYGRFGFDYDSGSTRRGYFLLNRTSQPISYFRPASATGPAFTPHNLSTLGAGG